MVSNNTWLETRIQRLLDGIIFVEKGLGVHMQRMLNMGRIYTLAAFLRKILGVKTKENGGLFSSPEPLAHGELL